MKKKLIWVSLVCLFVSTCSLAQNQAPTMQQSTSTTNERGNNQTKKRLQKEAVDKQKAMRDTPQTKPRRLRPDSLRRGGAIKVDTIR